MAEYTRRGFPVREKQLTPAQVWEAVQHHFASGQVADAAPVPLNQGVLEPVPEEEEAEPEPAAQYETVFYGSGWQLQQVAVSGDVSVTPLPALDPLGQGYWQVLSLEGLPFAWQGAGNALSCDAIFEALLAPASSTGLASDLGGTGPAPGTTSLAGMTAQGRRVEVVVSFVTGSSYDSVFALL
jgi:hypothetical protein